jgi:selenide,water dikinase
LKDVLNKYDIDVRQNLLVDEVTPSHVHVSSNENGNSGSFRQNDQIPYTHCIWATGAEAHQLSWDLQKQCGLSVNPDRGWIRVNGCLQSLSHPSVFAAGDCCEIVNENRKSPPKAGVYAVRSGPIIIENLTRFCERSTKNDEAKTAGLITYHPQDDFMKLLMCGDGTALGFRFGIPIYGKWVWQLKDTIDRMFMDLFDVKNLPNPDKPDKECCSDEDRSYDTSQYDAYEATEERMSADDAGKLLLRTDEDVDFQLAWNVIRDMMSDKKYKGDVLGAVLAQQMSGRI